MDEHQYIGSTFDSFLEEEGILEDCNLVALNRVKEFCETKINYFKKVEEEIEDEDAYRWGKAEVSFAEEILRLINQNN